MAMTGDEPLDEVPFSVDFVEVVLACPPAGGRGVGRRGTVLGRSRGDDGAEFYAAFFEDLGETSMIAIRS